MQQHQLDQLNEWKYLTTTITATTTVKARAKM